MPAMPSHRLPVSAVVETTRAPDAVTITPPKDLSPVPSSVKLGPSPDFLPIFPEDLAKLGIEAQFIPSIVSAASWVEHSPNGSPPLSPVEAENLIEILDKVRPAV